jgi:hypothetical protein
MKTKTSALAAIAAAGLLALGLTACGGETRADATSKAGGDAHITQSNDDPRPETVTVTETVTEEVEVAPEPAPEQEAEQAEPAETAGQENARRTAESYIDFSAFSRSGLIDQLKYEGYSKSDATYAVDAIAVDWNEQAAKSAQSYLDMSGFSRSGLIEQLVYEGFTQAQATYGVNKAGL